MPQSSASACTMRKPRPDGNKRLLLHRLDEEDIVAQSAEAKEVL